MSGNAIILGAKDGSRNIGDITARHLRARGWLTQTDDCFVDAATGDEDKYQAPNYNISEFDACVITLGHTRLTPFREASAEDVRAVLYGSLELPLHCARRYIQDREHNGRIVFIGSYAHNHSLTNCAAYCAAKAGLNAAVKEMGWELTPDFITHIVNPYHVPSTPMGESVVEGMMEHRDMTRIEAEAYQRKDLKMPRHQKPQDIAKIVCWLLNHNGTAAWMSGSAIDLYGGVR